MTLLPGAGRGILPRRRTVSDPLEGRHFIVVDDETDVCLTVVDLLPTSFVDAANDYESACRMLRFNKYDAAILDIMGVRGYDLLDEFAGKLPCVMLTARALGPADLKRAITSKA